MKSSRYDSERVVEGLAILMIITRCTRFKGEENQKKTPSCIGWEAWEAWAACRVAESALSIIRVIVFTCRSVSVMREGIRVLILLSSNQSCTSRVSP